MNIFILDEDPVIAAKYLNNSHITKMGLELTQILCNQFDHAPYRKTHMSHPCVVWAGSSINNFKWCVEHGKAIFEEYTYRYERIHKTASVLRWCENNYWKLQFPKVIMTPFVLAMPEEYQTKNAVKSYRNYYRASKQHLAKWTKREPPEWYK